MSSLEKVRAVYHCDMTSEFLDTSVSRFESQHWAMATPALRNISEAEASEPLRQCQLYLKALLQIGSFYTLPKEFFEAWVVGNDASFAVDDDPFAVALDAACMESAEFCWDGSKYVVFRVVNIAPETRSYVVVAHEAKRRHGITIQPCPIMMSLADRKQLGVRESSEQHLVDMRFLAKRCSLVLPGLFLLKSIGTKAMVVPKPRRSLQLQILDADVYAMPQDLGSNNIEAIVEAAAPEVSDLASAMAADDALAQTLQVFASRGALSRCISVGQQISLAHRPQAQQLATLGVISLADDNEGNMQVSILDGQYAYRSAGLLGHPVEAFRCLSSKPALQLPKLYHMVRLQEDGWQHQHRLASDFCMGGSKLYLCVCFQATFVLRGFAAARSEFWQGRTGDSS